MESVFFTNSILFFASLIALFCTITAYFVSHKTISAMVSICGAALAMFCITYALLLGANLYEVLVFVLILAAFSALTFLPHNVNGNQETIKEQESHDSSCIDTSIQKVELSNKGKISEQDYKMNEKNSETTIIATIPQKVDGKKEKE